MRVALCRRRALRAPAADAAAQGRGAAAELRRHPARRLAQHAGRRSTAASRAADSSTTSSAGRTRRCSPRSASASSCACSGSRSSAERLQSTGDLTFEGTGTRLGDALDRARDELSGLPVAGLVVVTDGADNAETTLDESIAGSQVAGHAGVRRRRRQGAADARRAGHARRDAAPRAQGRLARRRRRRHADRLRRREGAAHRRRRGPDGQHAGHHAAGRRRVADGEGAVQGVRRRAARRSGSGFRCRPTKKSRRTTSATRSSTSTTAARRFSTSRASRGPKPKFVRQATDDDDNLQVVAAAAHGGSDGQRAGQVPAAWRRRRRGAAERIPGDARGAVRLSRHHPRQRRGRRRSRPSSSGCSRTSWTCAAAACSRSAAPRSFAEGGWAGTPLSDALPVVLDRGLARPHLSAARARRAPDAAAASRIRRRRSPKRTEDGAGEVADLPPLTARQPVPSSTLKPGRDRAADRASTSAAASRSCWRFSATAAARRSCCRVQDTWLWRMHAKMAVEGHDAPHLLAAARRAGSSTACPIA